MVSGSNRRAPSCPKGDVLADLARELLVAGASAGEANRFAVFATEFARTQAPSVFEKLDPTGRDRATETMRGICLDGPAAGIKKFEPAQATAFLIWYEKGLRDVSASILFERYGVFLQFVSFRPFPAEACTAFASFFNEVYRANRSGYLSMFPRDHAEDVLADIYSHFIDRDYRRLREYTERPGVPFLAWFHTVAKNRAIELHRKLQIESRRRGELDRESERIPDPRPNPEDDVLRAKLRAAIQECFDRLNDRYRSVMQYVLDHPTSRDAIARALNLTTTQIYRITHEAREQLRRCLAESGF